MPKFLYVYCIIFIVARFSVGVGFEWRYELDDDEGEELDEEKEPTVLVSVLRSAYIYARCLMSEIEPIFCF